MKKIFLTLIIATFSYCSYAQSLPLTAGSSNPLTGDLYIDGTNGNRIMFSYGGVSNNKALLGSTYSIFGAGSKDDFATYIRSTNPYSIWTNNLQRLTVDGNGNVGIGTTSPLSLFSVGSSSQFQVSSSGNTTIGGDLNVAGTLRSYGPGAFDSNTVIGDLALSANTTGIGNVAIGKNAGRLFQTGQYNVFVGVGAASAGAVTGNYNNAIGYGSLLNLSSGTYNNAFGEGAGGGITTGISNTMMGDAAGVDVTTTNNNTGIGYNAGAHAIGNGWTAVGAYALKDGSASARDGSTAVGMQALQLTTGSYNTAIGIKAGYDNNTGSTLTGSYNNYLGTYAGQGNISGSYNTFIGFNSSLGSVNNYVVIADGQGHNRIVSDNNGNVGIGTASPAHILHVAQDVTMSTDVNVAQFAVSGASDNAKRLIFGYDVNGAGFGYIKAGWLGHQWTNLSLQPNGGFVGIGTTNPGTSLDLGTAFNTIKVATSNSGGTMYGIGANDGQLTFGAGIVVSGVPQMVLTNGGNFGIGTTNPAQKLHVNGVVRIDATANAYNEGLSINVPQSMGGYGGITIHSTTTGGSYDANSVKWLLYHNYTPENNIGGDGFAIAQNNTNTRFYISNTGNVGIGTTTVPSAYKLAVNGSMIATSVVVEAYANWPDYVFKKEHTLMPLADLKAYVDKNRHLPEVPSAAEVEKNGLDLGEMNKLLLKKLEEMTLYMIEKDKQVKAQEQRLKILEHRVEQMTKKD